MQEAENKGNNDYEKEAIEIDKTDSDSSDSEDEREEPLVNEEEEEDNSPFLGEYSSKMAKYLIRTSICYVYLNLFVLVAVILFHIGDASPLDYMFKNYTQIDNGYSIASHIILLIALVVCSVFEKFVRLFKIILLILFSILIFYLSCLYLRVTKKERYNFAEQVVSFLSIFYCSAIALLITVLVKRGKKYDPFICWYIALGLFAFNEFLNMYIFGLYYRHMWQIFIFFSFVAIWSFYVAFDAHLMINKRNYYYKTNDWMLGSTHLMTDWTFRFWYDLFK